MKYWLIALLAVFLTGIGSAGERMFSWGMAPARGDYVEARIKEFNLGKYLERCEINRPEVLTEIKRALDAGKYYRKTTRDQRGKNATITVNVNPNYQLRIVTYRDEVCDECGGTGSKEMPFGNITGGISAGLRCFKCKGDGVLEKPTTEKYFVLSPEDFEDAELARRTIASKDFEGAHRDAKQWVDRLVSKNPADRLAACEWLDQNYVRVGGQFTDIDPMLRKARYHEADDKRKIMVWQFWAGKDAPNGRSKAFYRIYANMKSGKITEKGFYPER